MTKSAQVELKRAEIGRLDESPAQIDKISHIDIVISHIDTVISHMNTVI
jgi:hypothetical protein